jgi:hypothetical protein
VTARYHNLSLSLLSWGFAWPHLVSRAVRRPAPVCAGHSDVVKGMSATLLQTEAVLGGLGSLGSIVCGVQAVASGCARIREKARPRRVGSRRGMEMITGEGGTRWLVRLSVPRRGGWRAWGAARRTFERALADPVDPSVISAEIGSEFRRGADYVRVVVVMTVSTADIAAALTAAWGAFRDAGAGDRLGWDMAAAEAEVRPEGGALLRAGSPCAMPSPV